MQISFAVSAKLISAFVFATQIVQFLFFLKSKISSLLSSPVAKQPGLCQTWSETPKTGFLVTRLVYMVWLFAKVYLFKNFINAPIKNIFTICVTSKPIIKSFIIKLNLNAYMVVFTNAILYEQKPQHYPQNNSSDFTYK